MSVKKTGKMAAMCIALAVAVIFLGLQSGGLKAQNTKPVKPATEKPQKKGNVKVKDAAGKVYTKVKVMPQFPGGEDARMKYLMAAIKYPGEAKESGIQGVVHVAFIVEKDGKLSNIKIVKGIGGGCDEEALRVTNEMPKWLPGKIKGNKSVRVQMTMPIKFTLK